MLYTKIQPQSFLGSGEEIFLSILPYIGMAAILFSNAKLFEQIVSTTWQKTPCEIWQKLASGFTEDI